MFNADYKNEITQVKPGQTITIELKTALIQDWKKADKGWVKIKSGNSQVMKIEVIETVANTGLYVTKYIVPKKIKVLKLKYYMDILD